MSAPNVTIRPLRDYSQHEVIPFYRYNPTGSALPIFKGTFVKIISGASPSDTVNSLGNVGAAWQNVVSDRYGVQPYVGEASSGDAVLGMTLYDVRELDENGEKLVFHPDKLERMQAVLSGWQIPILRRGFITYSGLEPGVSPVGGEAAYISPANAGVISTSGTAGVSTKVGKFLGPKDGNGWVYVWLDVT